MEAPSEALSHEGGAPAAGSESLGDAGHEVLRSSRSVQGRPLEYSILGSGPRTVFFLASIHGDEFSGTPLCEWLLGELQDHPELLDGVRVVVVPRVNPDGLVDGSRTNANGVDLNRNFPSSNFSDRRRHGSAPLSQPESRFLFDLFTLHPPDLVLSFHQAANLIDYDGPGEAWAAALAEVSPLSVRRMGTRPGSLGSWLGVELGVPTLTIELTRKDLERSDAELVERYGELCLRALAPSRALHQEPVLRQPSGDS